MTQLDVRRPGRYYGHKLHQDVMGHAIAKTEVHGSDRSFTIAMDRIENYVHGGRMNNETQWIIWSSISRVQGRRTRLYGSNPVT